MKKSETFFNEKYGKITNRSQGNRSHASKHNIEIFNSFNAELQLKNT